MKTCLTDYCRFNTNKMDAIYEGHWIGKMIVTQQDIDEEQSKKWFNTELVSYDVVLSCINGEGLPAYYLNNETKDLIKTVLFDTKDLKIIPKMPKHEISVGAELDECLTIYALLDEETQKKIIDAMLYENLPGGDLKVPVEFIEEEEDAEMTYRHHKNINGYDDETFETEDSEYVTEC